MTKIYPDISHYNVIGSWKEISQNVGFMICKATEGITFVDPYLPEFIKECERYGIPYWLYTYLRKGNELAQTKFMVKICQKAVGKMFQGYILDIEENNSEKSCIAALNWLKSQSQKTMIYLGYSDKNQYQSLIDTRGKDCAWWEARYGRDDGTYNPSFPAHDGADLHQYTSEGVCPGILYTTDLNRLTGTKPIEWFTGMASSAVEISLPQRGYFKVGDGYKQLKGAKPEIKKVQELANEIAGTDLQVDGKYGNLTQEAVKKLQAVVGVKEDGLFGEKTLKAIQDYRR